MTAPNLCRSRRSPARGTRRATQRGASQAGAPERSAASTRLWTARGAGTSAREAEAPLFDFQPYDVTSSVVDPRSPERAIAHDQQALARAIAQAGLALVSFHKGNWATPADYDGGQDLWVVAKA